MSNVRLQKIDPRTGAKIIDVETGEPIIISRSAQGFATMQKHPAIMKGFKVITDKVERVKVVEHKTVEETPIEETPEPEQPKTTITDIETAHHNTAKRLIAESEDLELLELVVQVIEKKTVVAAAEARINELNA